MENTRENISEMDDTQKIEAIYHLRNEISRLERVAVGTEAEIKTLKYAFECLVPNSDSGY